jgi:hypothetical protein
MQLVFCILGHFGGVNLELIPYAATFLNPEPVGRFSTWLLFPAADVP